MSILLKVVNILLKSFLPTALYSALINRVKSTKMIMTSTKTLSIFWSVLFFPIVLPLSLLAAIVKVVFLWVLGPSMWGNISYAMRMFYEDMTSTIDRKPFHIAIKRIMLFRDLVIKGKERKISCGPDNPDLTFFVIRPYYYLQENELATTVSHLLFHYYRNLQHLAYAVENGWIPVVDWENYGPFRHQEDYPINDTKNCWEYYWNQPSDYTLAEAYQSKNVILSIQNSRDNAYIPSIFFRPPLQKLAENYAIRCPQYDQLITLNGPTAEYVQKWQNELFPTEARILGVSVRAISYGQQRVTRHPIQPATNELVKTIRKYMLDWDMDYIFFACESETLVSEIMQSFENKVITLPRMRYKKQPDEGEENPLYVPGQRYQTNLDYLTEMVLLSRCNSLLAAMSGGVRVAIIWNANQYENMHIFEKGMW